MAHQRMTGPELTPAIVQDADDGRVLMLAWMDEEALRRTRETGEAWFWSRSRGELWHKGETSGNDARRRRAPRRLRRRRHPAPRPARRAGLPHRLALLLRAVALAPGRRARAQERPEGSYVAGLLEQGPAPLPGRSARRASRPRSPAYRESDERLIEELADLWFHSYVLLAARGLDPAAVEDELARRVE